MGLWKGRERLLPLPMAGEGWGEGWQGEGLPYEDALLMLSLSPRDAA